MFRSDTFGCHHQVEWVASARAGTYTRSCGGAIPGDLSLPAVRLAAVCRVARGNTDAVDTRCHSIVHSPQVRCAQLPARSNLNGRKAVGALRRRLEPTSTNTRERKHTHRHKSAQTSLQTYVGTILDHTHHHEDDDHHHHHNAT